VPEVEGRALAELAHAAREPLVARRLLAHAVLDAGEERGAAGVSALGRGPEARDEEPATRRRVRGQRLAGRQLGRRLRLPAGRQLEAHRNVLDGERDQEGEEDVHSRPSRLFSAVTIPFWSLSPANQSRGYWNTRRRVSTTSTGPAWFQGSLRR